jgi:hypothetical protein
MRIFKVFLALNFALSGPAAFAQTYPVEKRIISPEMARVPNGGQLVFGEKIWVRQGFFLSQGESIPYFDYVGPAPAGTPDGPLGGGRRSVESGGNADGTSPNSTTGDNTAGEKFVMSVVLNVAAKELGIGIGSEAKNYLIIGQQVAEIEFEIQKSGAVAKGLNDRANQIAATGFNIPRVDLGLQNVLMPSGQIGQANADYLASARKTGRVLTFEPTPKEIHDFVKKRLLVSVNSKDFQEIYFDIDEFTNLAATGRFDGTPAQEYFDDGVIQVKDSGLADAEAPFDGAKFKTDPFTPEGQFVRRAANKAQLAWSYAKYRGTDLMNQSSTFMQNAALLSAADARLANSAGSTAKSQAQAFAMAATSEKVSEALGGFSRGVKQRIESMAADIKAVPEMGRELADWAKAVANGDREAIAKGWRILEGIPEYTGAVYNAAAEKYGEIQKMTGQQMMDAVSEAYDQLTPGQIAEFVGGVAVEAVVSIATGGVLKAAKAASIAKSAAAKIKVGGQIISRTKERVGNVLRAGKKAGLKSGKELSDLSATMRAGANSLDDLANIENLVPGQMRHFNPINPGRLDDIVVGTSDNAAVYASQTFRSSTYFESVSDGTVKIYRVIGKDSKNIAGSYWSRTKPLSSMSAQYDGAIHPEFSRSPNRWVEVTVPKGEVFYEGIAAPHKGFGGGGHQVFLPQNPSDIAKWKISTPKEFQ